MDDNDEIEDLTPPSPNDGSSAEDFKKERVRLLNQLHKKLNELYSYQLHVGIYRLFKKELVSIADLALAFSLTPERIYHIVKKVEKELNPPLN